MAIEFEDDRRTWDNRFWGLALKSDKPMDTFKELTRETEEPPGLEDMPPERQAWYKA